eukprot:TRINITY_DN4034_c0_g1_i1.p1 TRINITY_DN4034_c0_g1~~TRINITY_DN4034_c0_g1_i1.p1  ORF type:complete len:329 (-),score=78.72 TRINITY_DN4034_c0_g1_i1:329-1315(-)
MEYHNAFDELNDSITVDEYFSFGESSFIDEASLAPSSPVTTDSESLSSMPSPGGYVELPDLFEPVVTIKPDPELMVSPSLLGGLTLGLPSSLPTLDAMETDSSCSLKRGTTTSTASGTTTRSKKRAPSTPTTTKKRTTRQPSKKQKVESKPVTFGSTQQFADSLKGKNSVELERMVEEQKMSMNEQEILKKQIRVMKNRESAQLSRERRKVYQDQLEGRYHIEADRSVRLKQQLLELEAENRVLQGELAHFNNLLKRSNLGKAFENTKSQVGFQQLTQTAATTGDPTSSSMFFVYLMLVLQSMGQQLYAFGPIKDPHSLIAQPIEAKA